MSLTTAAERELLEGMVDRQREEIGRLLDDVTEDEARERLVPSLTTVLGLVKHCTFVEQVWFHARVAGVSRTELGLPDDLDDTFRVAEDDTVAGVGRAYVEACERSRAITAEHELDELFAWPRAGRDVSLRFVLAHMVAELARHAGHGDILVEQLQAARAVSPAAQP